MIRFVRNNLRHGVNATPFSRRQTQIVRRVHAMALGCGPTALRELPGLARRLGVRAVLVKDESTRFGLKAFKGLGGFYAMFRMICEALGLNPEETTPETLRMPAYRDRIRGMRFATTTDGNHGKGVSWAAGVFGCQARVFMPKGTVEVRAQAIRDAGNAEVTITDMAYDDCVAWTCAMAKREGWQLIQDTSWPDYERVPLWIMQGYTTLFFEAMAQMRALGHTEPTHLLLQAGVGAMAGAVAGAALETCEAAPFIVTVEADEVACFYESFAANDGRPHRATGSGETIMAGLNCAVPCTLAWDILSGCAAGAFACGDEVSRRGMRLLSHENPPIVSGESGAVTAGLLDALAEPENRGLRDALGLDEGSVVLLISTEGDTDPENYRRIVGMGD
ncbi:MAG: diaminopropionate ammonia-lyase [Clostridia bacterium]|nr:diaminopropionate ammonia-lyase [Clostridia bacterium]